MERAEPTIRSACLKCIEQGATKIVCHPFFLSTGRHVFDDIPRILSEVQEEFPAVKITQTGPVGHHPKIVDLMYDTILAEIR